MKTNDENIITDINEINRRLMYSMWNITYFNSEPSGLSGRLIFPKKRDDSIRISEQESKILYCNILNDLNYFYSIETPTNELYQFKGKTPSSGNIDISLYEYSNKLFTKVVNIELKSKSPELEEIKKDFEKLIKENIIGNWYLTMKNIDNNSLTILFNKIIKSFKNDKINYNDYNIKIVFSICILECKIGIIGKFHYDKSKNNLNNFIKEFFKIRYAVRNNKMVINKNKHWQILKFN